MQAGDSGLTNNQPWFPFVSVSLWQIHLAVWTNAFLAIETKFLQFELAHFCYAEKYTYILCKLPVVDWPKINPDSCVRQLPGQIHLAFRKIHLTIETNTAIQAADNGFVCVSLFSRNVEIIEYFVTFSAKYVQLFTHIYEGCIHFLSYWYYPTEIWFVTWISKTKRKQTRKILTLITLLEIFLWLCSHPSNS